MTQAHAHLRSVADHDGIDPDAAEREAHDLLDALGVDLTDPSLLDPPRRMAALYAELLTPMAFNATTLSNDGAYDEFVVVTDIPFQSLCERLRDDARTRQEFLSLTGGSRA